MKKLGLAATLTGTLALILCIVGVDIPYREYHNGITFETYSGLWEICYVVGEPILRVCKSLDYSLGGDSMKAVKGLEILGIIILGFSLLSAFLKLAVKKDLFVLFLLSGGLAILSGILMITGTVIYGTKTRHEEVLKFGPASMYMYLHAGFGLCVTSGCLSIISGILYLFAGCHHLGNHQQRSDPNNVAYTSGQIIETPGFVLSVPVVNNLHSPPS